MMRVSGRTIPLSAFLVLLAAAAHAAPDDGALAQPDPWRILDGGLPRTPPIDAVAPCVPDDPPPELAKPGRSLAGDPAARRDSLSRQPGMEADAGAEEGGGTAAGLLRALAAARAASSDAGRRGARRQLAEHLLHSPSGERAACARLELARLELWLARYPEAASQALLAARAARELEGGRALVESARFLRAEALHLGGRPLEAAALYRELAEASARTGSAARLRLADTMLAEGETAAALEVYRKLLPEAGSFGAGDPVFGVRVVEAAIAERDLDGARREIERLLEADPPEPLAARLRLRLADILAAGGAVRRSRELLVALGGQWSGDPIGTLADVRLFAVGVQPGRPDLKPLRRAAGSTHKRVSRYARGLLAHALLERDRAGEALDLLTELAFETEAESLAPRIRQDLDALLASLTREAGDAPGCARLVERLGWRRDFLVRQAGRPEPFLTLGRCLETLGLPGAAAELYRSIAKRFGDRSSDTFSLSLARAALAAGDVAVARASALARSQQAGPHRDAWRLLLAKAELAAGNAAEALEIASPLVRRGAPEEHERDAVITFARAAARLPDPSRHARRLSAGLARLAGSAGSAELADPLRLAADAYRLSGQRERAEHFYRKAVSALPAGARRAEAAYWLWTLSGDDPAALEPLAGAAGHPEAGAWSTLAARSLDLAELRRRLGAAASGSRR